MSLSQYNKIRMIVVAIIAIAFSQSILRNSFIIPVAILAVSSATLFYLRRKVKGVIADERDYSIGGKAALLSIQLFSVVAVILMFFLYSIRELNVVYEPMGLVLAFSVCVLMLMYSIIFRIKRGKRNQNEK